MSQSFICKAISITSIFGEDTYSVIFIFQLLKKKIKDIYWEKFRPKLHKVTISLQQYLKKKKKSLNEQSSAPLSSQFRKSFTISDIVSEPSIKHYSFLQVIYKQVIFVSKLNKVVILGKTWIIPPPIYISRFRWMWLRLTTSGRLFFFYHYYLFAVVFLTAINQEMLCWNF